MYFWYKCIFLIWLIVSYSNPILPLSVPKTDSYQLTNEQVAMELKKCTRPISYNPSDYLKPHSSIPTENKTSSKSPSHALKLQNQAKLNEKVYTVGARVSSTLTYMNNLMTRFKVQQTLAGLSDQLAQASAALNQRLLRLGNMAKTAGAIKALSSLDKTASALLSGVGSVALFLGPIGASVGLAVAISTLVSFTPNDNRMVVTALQMAFDDIGRRFDIIEDKLDNVEFVIEKASTYNAYKINRDRINDVMLKFRGLATDGNEFAAQEFKDVCKYKDPELSLAWIHRHVVHEDLGLELLTSILRDVQYDRNQLSGWIDIIMKDALEAVFLREACLGARFGRGDGPDINRTDLICSIDYGRSEADTMIREIAQKLDDTETALMEDFDLAYLPQDLKMLIRRHSPSSPLCDLPKRAEEYLNEKYNWMRWWVALAKESIDIHSIDGHFAQVEARFGEKRYYLIAVCSEMGTLAPESDSISWDINVAPKFWENDQNWYIDEKIDFFDNILLVRSRSTEYECNFEFPEFSYVVKDQKRRKPMKKSSRVKREADDDGGSDGMEDADEMDNEIEQNNIMDQIGQKMQGDVGPNEGSQERTEREHGGLKWLWGNDGEKAASFFLYYKGRSLANSVGCRTNSKEMKKYNTTRLDHCSSSAFKRLVRNTMTKFASDFDSLHQHLNEKYSEFDWTIYIGQEYSWSLSTCESSPNCDHTEWSSPNDVRVIVIWTPKCNFERAVKAAKYLLQFTQRHAHEIFIDNEKSSEAVMEYFEDPVQYVSARDLTGIMKNMDIEQLQPLNYNDKIIFVNTRHSNPTWNVTLFGAGPNGAQGQLTIIKPDQILYIVVRLDFYVNYDEAQLCR